MNTSELNSAELNSAGIEGVKSKSLTADFKLILLSSTSIIVDFIIKSKSIYLNTNTNILIKKLQLIYTNIDIIMKLRYCVQSTIDIVIKCNDITTTFTIDVLKRLINNIKYTNIDITLFDRGRTTLSMDLCIRRIHDIIVPVTSDIMIRILDQLVTSTTDVMLFVRNTAMVTIDVTMKKFGALIGTNADIIIGKGSLIHGNPTFVDPRISDIDIVDIVHGTPTFIGRDDQNIEYI
jgi:hypothetical protein